MQRLLQLRTPDPILDPILILFAICCVEVFFDSVALEVEQSDDVPSDVVDGDAAHSIMLDGNRPAEWV